MLYQTPKISKRKYLINSSIWVFVGQFGSMLLRLASNLIMTRLLVPEMFGVMAIANTVMMGLFLCSYIGIHHSIIQNKRGAETVFLNTAWTIQVLRGAILCIFALVISIAVFTVNYLGVFPDGSVYSDSTLPYVIAALALSPLISGFESTNLASAFRNMLVKKLTQIEVGSQLVGILAMISFALIYKSIWALVIGSIVGAVAKVIAGYIVLPGQRNHFSWEKSAVYELFHFGKWLLLTTIMGFFVRYSDRLILGTLITPALLGIFSIAVFIINAIQDLLHAWVGKIVMPVLSEAYRNSPEDIGKVYYQFSLPFNIATLFLSGLLYGAGHVVIDFLYTEEFLTAGKMVEILSISLLGSRVIIADQFYLAIGKSRLQVPQNILQLAILFFGIIPAYRFYGIDGALYVIGCAILLALPITWFLLRRLGVLNWKQELVSLPALFLGYGFSKLFVMVINNLKVVF